MKVQTAFRRPGGSVRLTVDCSELIGFIALHFDDKTVSKLREAREMNAEQGNRTLSSE
jgi:hypothetical protein